MKKNTIISSGMILFGTIVSLINLSPDYSILEIKLAFVGKIALVVGLISLWLFSILPYWGEQKHKL